MSNIFSKQLKSQRKGKVSIREVATKTKSSEEIIMSNLQQLSDRVEHLEKLASETHPDAPGYVAALALQHGPEEDRISQAQKAKKEADAAAKK